MAPSAATPWWQLLLLLYAASLPFVRIWYWPPPLQAKVQPTELIFLLLLPGALSYYRRRDWQSALPTSLWLALGAYLLANGLAALGAGQPGAVLEAMGRVYLVVVFLLVVLSIRDRGEDWCERLLRAWTAGAVLMAGISVAAYVLALAGWSTALVQTYINYPYFGTLLRATGFTGGPGMLILVLFLPTLWTWRRWREKGSYLPTFLLLFTACGLSWSKEMLLLLTGMVLADPLTSAWSRRYKGLMLAGIALVSWLSTHLLLLPNRPLADSYLAGTEYTAGRVLATMGSWQLVETTYLTLKQAALTVAGAHPWWGVGPGQFNAALEQLQTIGDYPAGLPAYDPHSTWWGALAETGLVGLLTLGGIIYLLIRFFNNYFPAAERSANIDIILIYLVLMLIESVQKDMMNFRHLWFALALAAGSRQGANLSGKWRKIATDRRDYTA